MHTMKEIHSVLCPVQGGILSEILICAASHQSGGSGISADFTYAYEDVVCERISRSHTASCFRLGQ